MSGGRSAIYEQPARVAPARFVVLSFVVLMTACRAPAGGALRPLFHGLEERREWVMGTPLRIAIEPPRGAGTAKASAVLDEAFAAARALDALLSDYQPGSPLSQLNAKAGGEWLLVDRGLYAFVRRALLDTKKTGGLFDVTVGALTLGYRKGLIEGDASLAAARARSGPAVVELDGAGRVRLKVKGARLDPGGIGKGHAIDAIVAVLRARGVTRGYVDFGGSSVYGLGAPAGRRGWPVLIPGAEPERPLGVLWLKDDGLSTSEALPPPDAQKSRRRGHIVDPRSGRLIEKTRFALCLSASGWDAEVVTKPLVIAPRFLDEVPARFPGALGLVHEAGKPPRMNEALRARLTPADAGR